MSRNDEDDTKHGSPTTTPEADGQEREQTTAGRAIVAARDADERPDTTEIRALTASAGYEVVGEVIQRRSEDATYALGRGKAEELMRRADETDADAVVYDGELSPGQTASLAELLPAGVAVVDRTRLVLDLFAEGAGSRAAELQIELVRLRYRKPRLRERIARDYGSEVRYHNEDDRRILDLERRIESTERALADISDARTARRERRRAAGFDLVTIAGYTNAGKSTLLRRLADDVTVDPPSESPDLEDTVTVADRLFETLETTTRRATIGGRRVLLTDTVGFVDALPHRAVRSFRATLQAVRDADATLLVVDAADEPDALARKLRVSLRAIDEPSGPVIPVLNKADLVDGEALATRRATIERVRTERAGCEGESPADWLREPLAVSACFGDGTGALESALCSALPRAETTFHLPNSGATQALLSWAYERGEVRDVDYDGDRVRIVFAGRPSVVAEAERKATTVED